ncbi:MAG: tetratricopeptide repeat protein [Acidimicrobiia bacterium]|nr:tetratricopeptide repeat protein [Acidimicrobiia bacterium]
MGDPIAPYVPRVLATWPDQTSWQEIEGTLASVDLSGFTRLSERLARHGRLGAEEIAFVVSGIFTRLIDVAFAAGGDILKFGGDAILVLFTGDEHARRAATVVTEMQRLIRTEGRVGTGATAVRLRMSVGVHSGSFWFFLVGATHHELVIAGPDATTTVQLESDATAGQILVSAATAEQLPAGWSGQATEDGVPLRLARVDRFEAVPVTAAPPTDPTDPALVPLGLRAGVQAGTTLGEHRPATIAFVEVPHLDRVAADEGPPGVLDRLAAVAEAIDAAVEEHGITWLASDIVADGAKLILAAGAPTSTENDEERMLRAARQISDACQRPPLQIGVNRGPIFMGDVGHPDRRSYTVMGDAVNLAARLMAKSTPGEVIVERSVLDRSSARFEVDALEPFLVKGKTAPIHAAALGRLAGWDRTATVQLPIIGRDRELARLGERARSVTEGGGASAQIVADAGMGKSRLVEELRSTVRDLTWLSGHSEPYAQTTPYFVVRWILRPLAGIELDEAPDPGGVALARWVGQVAPDLTPWLPLIATCFGVDVPASRAVDELDPSLVQAQLHEVVADLLGRTVTGPTGVVVEDLHWADQASIELLGRLATEAVAMERPWFVLATSRPSGPELPSPTMRLELEPLGAEDASRLAVVAAGDRAIGDAELARIATSGGGNPLFLRELAAMADDLAGEAVPETVERLIGSRIDTLPPEHRALLRDASVLGSSVDLALLAEVLGDPDVGERARWSPLEPFVTEDGPGSLRFRHDLVRAGAYAGLSYRRRRELHGRAGDAIVARAARPEDAAPALSLHFSQGGRLPETWEWSVRAADRAASAAAMTEVVELLQRALAAARASSLATPAELARVSEQLGDAADRIGRFPLAHEAYRAARQWVRDDPVATARLLRKHGVIADHQGRYTASLRWYGRGLTLLRGLASPEAGLARAELELAYGVARYYQGRFGEALRRAQAAGEIGRALGDRSIEAQAELQLEMACSDLRLPERVGHGARSLELLEDLGDDLRLGNLLLNLGVSSANEGRWDEARACYERSAAAYRQAGDVVGAASTLNNEAEILTDQGRIDDAETRLLDARRIYRSAGYEWGVALTTSGLSRLALRRGRVDEAHELLDRAEAEFRDLDSTALVIDTRVRQVELLVYEGRVEDACALADDVDTELEAFGHVAMLPATMLRLRAMLDLQRGSLDSARRGFESAIVAAEAEDIAYEVALALAGLDAIDRAAGRDADAGRATRLAELCAGLGVVALPAMPLGSEAGAAFLADASGHFGEMTTSSVSV